MPVTITAKRALRSSNRKKLVNDKLMTELEIAMRMTKKTPNQKTLAKVSSLADRAVKKKIIHKNKASRIKSQTAALLIKKEAVKKSVK